ncbi:tRNA uridine-5-carboxymethylaminomethyl(34) synthesis GTPase MnmE [Candidatus Zinderia endosymbiont of Aphrophora alni]|uniref:tRNA uridine-5-carboxymethylaminomethyl(34) synthesis GTPase MnmE n=1 Tax=Candidatus Zinderia endosymbiont of Aphrophora alni TaxID=3077951 RepID=UPI0030D6288B
MNLYSHPIIAISTSLNKSAIGIIRISGENLWIIINKICNKNKNNLKPRYATYTSFKNIKGNIIDYGLIIYFKAPNSYTGENLLEIHSHGNPIIMNRIFSNCLKIGKIINLKIAKPGEFTQRAFLNKKIDLIQAEAIADLIKASTKKAAKFAINSLKGKLSFLINNIEKKIKKLRIFIEAYLNFPEEIIIKNKNINIYKKLIKIKKKLKQISLNISKKIIFNNGINTLIIGKPNVGKSSLLNILSNTKTAIVTNIAGTTRDKLITKIEIKGIIFNIIDTAGIKNINKKNLKINIIEKIGIKKTLNEIKNSNIILYVFDICKGISKEDKKNIKKIPKNIKKIFIWNKIDILNNKLQIKKNINNIHIFLSAKKNIGINFLKKKLKNNINYNIYSKQKYMINKKQLIIFKKIKKHLKKAIFYSYDKKKKNININDFLAEELKIIQNKLNKITGKKHSKKILKNIFSKFCIGK